jgi:DNA-binding transcriptional LysR family regulator
MTMELRHLRCFLAIAEEGTLTRAATRLHLTQPVVSRTLRQLEDHLGVRLIDRSTHHLGLTAAGHAFQIRAASAVAAADTAFNTDDWLAAIAAGKAVGVTTTATASVHPYPGIAYVPLAGAADLTVSLAWTHPPTHPAIAKLVALAREVVGYRAADAT